MLCGFTSLFIILVQTSLPPNKLGGNDITQRLLKMMMNINYSQSQPYCNIPYFNELSDFLYLLKFKLISSTASQTLCDHHSYLIRYGWECLNEILCRNETRHIFVCSSNILLILHRSIYVCNVVCVCVFIGYKQIFQMILYSGKFVHICAPNIIIGQKYSETIDNWPIICLLWLIWS